VTRLVRVVAAVLGLLGLHLTGLAGVVDAGGPLYRTVDGQPVPWADHTITGGPLQSTTISVDATGRRTVLYRVDPGPLGSLSNADATRFVDRIFGLYNGISPSEIEFVNAGPIRDPATGAPLDVDGTNFGRVLGTFQNPIIFDHDASIVGPGGVLGFAGALTFTDDGPAVAEAFAVLNGTRMFLGATISVPAFQGVFTHEFGHFAGPLDHSQINGFLVTLLPSDFDLLAPFVETMHPFFHFTPPGSQLGFENDLYFFATLDRDTINAFSNLYPTKAYKQQFGAVEGRVIFRSGGDLVAVDGINVIARRIDQGQYLPPVGTVAFPDGVTLDANGIPAPPPARAATDALATVSSAVTGIEFGTGRYRIRGLPPGQYLIHHQTIRSVFVGISRIGRSQSQILLPFFEGYYNGTTTSNSPGTFTPVTIRAGEVTTGIDLVINGLDPSEPAQVNVKKETHLTFETALALPSPPVVVKGSVADTDPFALFFPPFAEPLHDIYRFDATRTGVYFISLEPHPTSSNADLDVLLFRSNGALAAFSIEPTARELIGAFLTPGTYFVSVSAFAGAANYHLRVLPPP